MLSTGAAGNELPAGGISFANGSEA
ncbi:uncharacterized protein METZ01_LOCUS164061, partial [marine metagenome]